MSDYLAELVRISDALAWEPDRADSYLDAVRIIQEVMGADMAPSFLLDGSGRQLLLVAEGDQERMLRERGYGSMPAAEHVRAPWINEEEWPVSASDHLDHESWRLLPQDFKDWFGTSGIVASIHADGRHLGAVLLTFDHAFRMSLEQRAFLAAAGRILGCAVHRWQTARRERELGALDERRRLADELHADLSQQVAALGLGVEAMRLDAQDVGSAPLQADADKLRESVGALKRSLRYQMLGLRSDAGLVDEPLSETIRQQLATFESQMGIAAIFECDGAADGVPLAIAAQLVRVLQEALGNAYLHAQASQVRVSLRVAQRLVRLEIADDGAGFDPGQVAESRLGLRIMRERMNLIDGTLSVESVARGGTRVVAEAPLRSVQALTAADVRGA